MALGHHQDAGDGHDHDAQSHADGDKHAEESGNSPHCGPCASCCASASIAPLSDVSASPGPTTVEYVFSQFLPIGIQPDGLYRPPLSL